MKGPRLATPQGTCDGDRSQRRISSPSDIALEDVSPRGAIDVHSARARRLLATVNVATIAKTMAMRFIAAPRFDPAMTYGAGERARIHHSEMLLLRGLVEPVV